MTHLLAHDAPDLADVGVDLIKHQYGDAVMRGEYRFDGEHDARDLAAGGDGFQRSHRLAGVGGETE